MLRLLVAVLLAGVACGGNGGGTAGLATTTPPTTSTAGDRDAPERIEATSTPESPLRYVAAGEGAEEETDYPTIQAAIDAANPYDEVILRSGTHVLTEDVIVDRPVVLRAERPGEAVVTTSPTPPSDQRDESLPVAAIRIEGEAADGTEVRDLRFENIGHSFTGQALSLERVRDVVVRGNVFRYTGSQGVLVFDTADVEVTENQFLNPYLPGDQPNSILSGPDNRVTTESYMDYGILVYGSTNPVVDHNYFFGIFHQALSFKEGNTNATARYNTFEGFAYTALFVGQNRPGGNSFTRFGAAGSGPEQGDIEVVGNLFRPVADEVGEYVNSIAIRVSYAEANIHVADNVVDAAYIPFQVDCNDGGAPTCATGTLSLVNNVFAGTVQDTAGRTRRFDKAGCVLLRDLARGPLRVDMERNTFVGCGLAYEAEGLLTVSRANLFVDVLAAPDGAAGAASGNVVWNAVGDYGPDTAQLDPGLSASSVPPKSPEVRFLGADGWRTTFLPSDEFSLLNAVGAR